MNHILTFKCPAKFLSHMQDTLMHDKRMPWNMSGILDADWSEGASIHFLVGALNFDQMIVKFKRVDPFMNDFSLNRTLK